MKKIGMDEFFILSAIADKMDFELPEMTGEGEKAQKEYGMKLIALLLKKAHKAKDEIIELVESVTGKKSSEMTIKEIIVEFKGILEQDGVVDAFK